MKRSRVLLTAAVSAAVAGTCLAGAASAAPSGPAATTTPAGSEVARLSKLPASVFRAPVAAKAPVRASVQQVPHLDQRLTVLAGTAAAKTAAPVHVTISGPAAAAAATAAGAKITSTWHGLVSAVVAPTKLRALAAHSGITAVEPSVQAVPQALKTSEGVIASGAQSLFNTNPSNGGSGVNIAIVDAGFGGEASAVSSGALPVNTVFSQNIGCDSTGVDATANTDHGVAVAEIVHQMAPNARLFLYCIDNSIDFASAAQAIQNRGDIKIVNSSLGFVAESTGDGSGTTEQAVASARAAGILWIQSSGNNAADHWAGDLSDYTDQGGGFNVVNLLSADYNADVTALDPGESGEIDLRWGTTPTPDLAVTLWYQELNFDTGDTIGAPVAADYAQGDSDPYLSAPLVNNTAKPLAYQIYVTVGDATPATHYDLFYSGDVYPSGLSGLNATAAARAAAGSVLQPASSTSALAVGAVNWRIPGATESFSSRGPTITGAVKPDLLGFDGVSTNVADVTSNPSINPADNGFYGTSAAAPHVAGAAAVLLSANPTWTADQVETALEAKTSPHTSPATNDKGAGLLQLTDRSVTTSCPARTTLPAKVAIDRQVVTFAAPLTTTCTNYTALATLAQDANVLDNLAWTSSAPNRTVYFSSQGNATGTYSTRFVDGFSDANHVSWGTNASVVLKYATYDYIASSRKNTAVYVNGLLHNYSNTPQGITSGAGRLMYLQRYINGTWQTMLSRPVNAAGQFVVGFVQRTVFQYRLVTTESATQFSAYSASAFR